MDNTLEKDHIFGLTIAVVALLIMSVAFMLDSNRRDRLLADRIVKLEAKLK